MSDLSRIGKFSSVFIKTDADGFLGRECPEEKCKGYFKIQPSPDLQKKNIFYYCPYCGHFARYDHFWTKKQIKYVHSMVTRKFVDAIHKDLKKMEFNHKPHGNFGIEISMKVSRNSKYPIRQYREKKLKTEVVCKHCTLRYAIYGVFAFCPNCGKHNSLQILDINLGVVEKMLVLAGDVDIDVADRLIENALEDCVSAFDGFGRELCRRHAGHSTNPKKAEKISFQNLEGAMKNVAVLFSFNLSDLITSDEWTFLYRGFQKRHLIAHNMRIVDQAYINKVDDMEAIIGRIISVSEKDVRLTMLAVRKLADGITEKMAGLNS